MKAKDIISPLRNAEKSFPGHHVPSEMMIADVLPRLIDTPDRLLGVTSDEGLIGVIDETSMLEGLSRLIAARDDSSWVVVEVAPSSYSATTLAKAVEDADTHLVDLWSAPGEGDNIRVTLRVRSTDPSEAAASLERYGFTVIDASGENYRDKEVAMERLLALRALLNV